MSAIRTEHFSPRPIVRARRRDGTTLIGLLAERALRLFRHWQHQTRLREEGRRLSEANDYVLRDVGVTRGELLCAVRRASPPLRR